MTAYQREQRTAREAVANFHARQRQMPALRRQLNRLKLNVRREKIAERKRNT